MLGHMDIVEWAKILGTAGVLLVIFVETGVFIGFFLPGDSLLFAAGLLAARGIFNIGIIVPGAVVMAFLGYVFGYWFGKKLGMWLLRRPDAWWFKRSYIRRAKKFYIKHGRKAVLLGRFIPFIRTFVPVIAGMAKMRYKRYTIYNGLGAVLWGTSMPLIGYFSGRLIPNIDTYTALVILGLVVLISLVPAFFSKKKHRH